MNSTLNELFHRIYFKELFLLPRYWLKRKKVKLNKADSSSIRIMSFNIRCVTREASIKNSWFYRAPLVINNIRCEKPDIMGFQEAMSIHYKYIKKTLKGYNSVVSYRDLNKLSEACPIFYRTDKFDLVDKGSFWLSETPDKMSKDWNSGCYRICTYVILKQISDNSELIVFNTHLDNESEQARQKGIKLILSKIERFKNKPSIIMGDFNASPASPTYEYATNLFIDANQNEVFDSSATYQNYGKELNIARIDYFMLSRKGINIKNYKVVKNVYNNTYPSDHFPIIVDISLI